MKKMLATLVLLFAVNVHATPTISPGAPVQIGGAWYLPLEVSGVGMSDSLHVIAPYTSTHNVEVTGSLTPTFNECLCGDWLPGNYWDPNMGGLIHPYGPSTYQLDASGWFGLGTYDCGVGASSGTIAYMKLVGEGSIRLTDNFRWKTCDNIAPKPINVNTSWVQVPPQGTGGGGGGGQWEEGMTVTQEKPAAQPKAKLPMTWGRIKAMYR
jgi:hypothetical protein